MVDWVRSCYSTIAVMQQDGTTYPIDWYFVPVSAPLLDGLRWRSNNWTDRRDRVDLGQGEVYAAARTYRKGALPAYVGFDAQNSRPVAGALPWWSLGSPSPGSGGIRFDGSKGYTDVLGPGVFPTPVAFPTSLTSSTGDTAGSWTNPGGLGQGWQFGTFGNNRTVGFRQLATICPVLYPALYTLWGALASSGLPIGPLECTSYDLVTKVSVWRDHLGGRLLPGEILTLHGV